MLPARVIVKTGGADTLERSFCCAVGNVCGRGGAPGAST